MRWPWKRRPDVPPSVTRPVWAVGDIHGRLDALKALLGRLADGFAAAPDGALVFLGDYVDRGPDAAAVLRRLQAMAAGDAPVETICLMGNHERMMLDAMDAPEARGPTWLRGGGAATCASFGTSDPAGLRAALPRGLEDWLRGLPRMWQDGDLVCVHAALDPHGSLRAQDEDALIWGHPAFGRVRRRDGLWVAHGHTIVDAPRARAGRISVDTGAWRTGRLTAAHIPPGLEDAEGIAFTTTDPVG